MAFAGAIRARADHCDLNARVVTSMDAREQRELVRRGYDRISSAYRDDSGQANPACAAAGEDVSRYAGWISELRSVLAPPARVLDLGCGNGLPATRLLVGAGFAVTGLDFSSVQIERARRLVPQATFIEADLTGWDCPPASFGAVVSFYALIHVPLDDQRALFPRIRQWLEPGGHFMATLGYERWTGIEGYLGTPMFWDHADRDTYLEWLRDAGLNPVWHRFVSEGTAGHTLVLAKAAA